MKVWPAICDVEQDYSSLRPWADYNWRTFTIARFDVEIDHIASLFEINAGMFGVRLRLAWQWDGPGARELRETMQLFRDGELKGYPISSATMTHDDFTQR